VLSQLSTLVLSQLSMISAAERVHSVVYEQLMDEELMEETLSALHGNLTLPPPLGRDTKAADATGTGARPATTIGVERSS
jgi:hypothetical protein